MLLGLATASAAVLMPVASASAQSDMPESKKMVASFDLQMQKMRQSKLYQATDMEDLVADASRNSPLNDVDLKALNRVVGGASAPASLAEFEDMERGSELPFEFFLQLHFADEASAKQAFAEIERKSRIVEVEGKKFFKPKSDNEPSNISAHFLNASTVEFGTDGYLTKQNRNFQTDRLAAKWKAMPDTAIRLAIDLESAEGIVKEGMALAKDELPSQAGMFVDLVGLMSALQLNVDLDAQNIVELHADARNAEDATRLTGGLNAILSLAKVTGGQAVKQGAQQMPEAAKVAGAMLDSLEATQEGNRASIVITKPEGFDDAVISSVKQARKAAEKMKGINNFRQYALSVHNYHDTYNAFPWNAPNGSGQSEDISWRVRVLPFLEQYVLYDQMDLEQAHDGDLNKMFAEQMPEIYGADGKSANVCRIVPDGEVKSFAHIRDGTSNTIMLIEHPAGVPWMAPRDITADEAVELVTGLMDGQQLIIAMYDGSVRRISGDVPEETLRRLFDPDDGQKIEGFFD